MSTSCVFFRACVYMPRSTNERRLPNPKMLAACLATERHVGRYRRFLRVSQQQPTPLVDRRPRYPDFTFTADSQYSCVHLLLWSTCCMQHV